jgi:hypothetical protein
LEKERKAGEVEILGHGDKWIIVYCMICHMMSQLM